MTHERRRLLLGAVGAFSVLGAGAVMPAFAGLPEVIAQARPSVLPIGLWDPLGSPRFNFRGTCFVVGNGNYVVTNEHVTSLGKLSNAASADAKPAPASARYAVLVRRGTEEGEFRTAELVTTDATHDLALLRIGGAALPAVSLGDAERAREGQAIALMGYPIGGVLGFQLVTHSGIISSIAAVALPARNAAALGGRGIAALRRGLYDIYQLDATAYPGNSGGPVFDVDSGKVIAVVNKVLGQGSRESALSHPTGISYAIPVRYVQALVDAHAR